MNPSSGFVVRVEHLPDRTYRLWLQTSGVPLDLGTIGRTSELYPATKARVAAHARVSPEELGGVELVVPAPPWFREGQPVLVHDEDDGWVLAYVRGFIQGGFLVERQYGGGSIHPQEDVDFDPPAEAITWDGRRPG